MAPKKRTSAKSSRASSAVLPVDSDVEIVENTGTNSPATSLEEEAKDSTFDPAQEAKEEAVVQEDFVQEAKPKVRSTFLEFFVKLDLEGCDRASCFTDTLCESTGRWWKSDSQTSVQSDGRQGAYSI